MKRVFARELHQNREALFKLADDTDEAERLSKAELARQLGRFEESQVLLTWEWSPEALPAVVTIRRLAVAGDPRPARINLRDAEIGSQTATAWTESGDAAAASGDYEKALGCYKRAAEWAPKGHPGLPDLHDKIRRVDQQIMH